MTIMQELNKWLVSPSFLVSIQHFDLFHLSRLQTCDTSEYHEFLGCSIIFAKYHVCALCPVCFISSLALHFAQRTLSHKQQYCTARTNSLSLSHQTREPIMPILWLANHMKNLMDDLTSTIQAQHIYQSIEFILTSICILYLWRACIDVKIWL